MRKNNVLRLTESAVMIAFATVLSVIKLIDMPYGGSVTLCSMIPLTIIAYRYGFIWGAFSSVVYSLVQLLLGTDNLSYATSATAVVLIIVFDYVLAFTGYSFAGLFSTKISQTSAMSIGVVLSGIFRYLCHTVVGYAVWRDISLPTTEAWIYSFSYNAVYMIPEIISTVIAVICLSRLINFKSTIISASTHHDSAKNTSVLLIFSRVILTIGSLWSVVLIFSKLQNDTGAFSIKGLANVNWAYVVTIIIISVVLSLILDLLSRKSLNRNKK